MFLATKIGWAALALTLATTVMFVRDFPHSSASTNFDQEEPATFVVRDEITKMQEGLRNKGNYRGKIDGVLGLRTRASIREYQKAENLPITGQVDTPTADGLGVRPEASWDNSKSVEREIGHRDKPSAGIQRAQVRAGETRRKKVPKATTLEASVGAYVHKQDAENDKNDQ